MILAESILKMWSFFQHCLAMVDLLVSSCGTLNLCLHKQKHNLCLVCPMQDKSHCQEILLIPKEFSMTVESLNLERESLLVDEKNDKIYTKAELSIFLFALRTICLMLLKLQYAMSPDHPSG